MFSLNTAQRDRNTSKILKLSTKEIVPDKTNCHILQSKFMQFVKQLMN